MNWDSIFIISHHFGIFTFIFLFIHVWKVCYSLLLIILIGHDVDRAHLLDDVIDDLEKDSLNCMNRSFTYKLN